jgi:hypothetical protein
MTEYVKLHARSAFSFLEGGTLPELLIQQAADLAEIIRGAPKSFRGRGRKNDSSVLVYRILPSSVLFACVIRGSAIGAEGSKRLS